MRVLAVVLVAAGLSATLWAQAGSGGSYGNIYGKVTDESGGVLPGVTVMLSGVSAPQTVTTGSQGEFRFLNLSPGSYTLKAELAGFSSVERPNVIVNLRSNTEITIPMKLAAVTATITVTSESPLLDTRKQQAGSTYDQKTLESIPTGRDPWVIIQLTPGVQIDRLNIGGTQSGQQSAFIGKGTDAGQNTFNVDGVTITDAAAAGSSPTYYDFDSFQEMQVGTGGTDPSIASAGVSLNMVTKRGTNLVHGSGRYFVTPWRLQANNLPQEAKDEGYTNRNVDRVSELQSGGLGIQDYGIEVGGPVWPDKAWLWGSYAEKIIPLTKLGPPGAGGGFGPSDTTYLENYSAKANVQPIEAVSLTGFFLRGDKKKFGRSAGRTRPPETSVDQKGPTTIWKGEASAVMGTSFVASGSYSYVSGGFQLTPEGGLGVDAYQDAAQVYHRSYADYHTVRPQHQVTANASGFFNTGTIGHELKGGFSYRTTPITSESAWPGTGNVGREGGGSACAVSCADVTRASIKSYGYKYTGAFLSDTLTASNLTVNLGVRYDYQYGTNNPSTVPDNPTFPDLVPGIDYPGHAKEFSFKNWQPRAAVTYALGDQKTTLLRASYARYADGIGGSLVTWDNPLGGISGTRFEWTDANGNHNVDPGELGAPIRNLGGFDPSCPGCLSSANSVDPNLKNTTTDEFTVGVEHQIVPEFVVGLSYNYRTRKNFIWSPYTGVTNASYTEIWPGDPTLPGNGLVGVDKFGNVIGTAGPVFTGTLPDDFNGGEFVTNRPDYSQKYSGVELQLNKRLTNRWMAHAAFAYNDWKQKVKNVATGCIDPTNQVYPTGAFFVGQPVGSTCQDGAQLYQESVGSGNFGNVWIGSKWSFNVTGLYQLPWNFNIGANLYGRQGYMNPYYVLVDTGNGEGPRYVQIGTAADHRLKNVYNLDLRLDKVLEITQKVSVTLSVELFNALNDNTILQRETDATPDPSTVDAAHPNGVAVAGSIDEIQNPRAVRIGARVSF